MSSVMRLQGGFHANPLRVLTEDLSRNARDLLTEISPSFASKEDFSTSAATQPLADFGLLGTDGILVTY